MKRLRWATERHPGHKGDKMPRSIFRKRSEKLPPGSQGQGNEIVDADTSAIPGPGVEEHNQRRIYVNTELPSEELDEDGHPIAQYARNKIRTAKYTPLSFVPKNLWLQFHNIANIYFLFVVILQIFPVFGVTSPGIACIPLVAILVITAIKDGIEDYRRTVLDLELNNTPVHLLVGWHNVNVTDDVISLWRRIKKATSRGIFKVIALIKATKRRKNGQGESEDRGFGTDLARSQTRASVYSMNSEPRESIQMTPVVERRSFVGGEAGYSDGKKAEAMFGGSKSAPGKFYGSVIDPSITPTGEAKFRRDRWKNVRVGDFVRIYNDDQVPADVVILATSDADGACYVETKNLDGETNLKVRHALHCGAGVKHAKDCEKAKFRIESEPPHANLYAFNGVIRWTQAPPPGSEGEEGSPMSEAISINNLLLRGCSLRNTQWAIGVVIYTGDETKIMMNAGITPTKRSRITRELNINVLYNFGILFILCLLAGIIQGVTWSQGKASLSFYEYVTGSPEVQGIITFWVALILFQTLVPISLYISMEIIKTAQAFFIFSDVHMYYETLDYPCTPKSWNISDDLGQIEYIFSDKTGTLTQNVMEFKKCTINGIPYGEAYTEAQAGMQKRQGINVEEEGAKVRQQIAQDRLEMFKLLSSRFDNPYVEEEKMSFVSSDFVKDLDSYSGDAQAAANQRFMLALALCHSVLPEASSSDPFQIEFKAQSPDEAALVSTARDLGFALVSRTQSGLILNVQGNETEYQVLNTLEFNSARKRMSAIIRMPDGKIVLFCKGADSIIYSRLTAGQQQDLRKTTADHLEMFAREGLRTLCIAEKELSEADYREWVQEYDEAAAAIVNRDEKIEEVSEMIERDLTLLGGTAIEDRLQDGVPESISLLGEAGIKLWVLTGDKVETAINIGFSCNLLNNSMDLILVQVPENSVQSAHATVKKCLRQYFNLQGGHDDLMEAKRNHDPPPPTHALIIDGDALRLVLDESVKSDFLLLCKHCKSVLCCRVSPSQKAAVVQLVKAGLDVMTLAIGDGANDVAMIQQADVGVGIVGEEGRQAAMSSDYAIGQFRYLSRLVLVHGRWSYRRVSEMIANFFYKNVVWTLTLFWYQIYCNFDGSILFEFTYLLLYNLAFTSLPVILMGTLDQDVDDKVSLAVPQLYQRGILRLEWTQTKFWIYMIDGVYQSLICFYLPYLEFATGSFASSSGRDLNNVMYMGVYVANASVVVANFYVLMNQYRWDWLFLLIVMLGTLLIWLWTGIYSQFKSTLNFYHSAEHVYGSLSFWLILLITVVCCLLPRFACKVVQKLYFPYDIDIIREQVREGKFQYLYADEGTAASLASSGSARSDVHKSRHSNPFLSEEDDERPFYPPSVAPTATTVDKRESNHGSDGTGASDIFTPPNPGFSNDQRPRNSFERMRASMDRTRPSFEASNDFTSAAMLARMESSHSRHFFHRRQSGLASELQM